MTHKLTPEQEAIADADYSTGLTVVNAYAGTGKTTALQLISEANLTKKLLYVAFNRALAMEARQRFDTNVRAATIHALAYSCLTKELKEKVGNIRLNDLMPYVGGLRDALLVKRTLDNFCYSADAALSKTHVPREANDPEPIIAKTRQVMTKMLDPGCPLKLTHDVYLKTWATGRDSLPWKYDLIMLDEAQDTNPVTYSLLLRLYKTGIPLILVGDMHQAIYAWRGARDAMRHAMAEPHRRFNLTASFRLTPALAADTSLLLQRMMDDPVNLVGKMDANGKPRKEAVIARSNAMLIRRAYDLIGVYGRKVHWIGTTAENHWDPASIYDFDDVLNVYRLFSGGRPQSGSPVGLYGSWAELQTMMESDEVRDPNLGFAYDLVKEYRDKVPLVLKTVSRGSRGPDQATVILTTAHKAKGLEWDQVALLDDFLPLMKPPPPDMDLGQVREERNLTYVAMTRARQRLEANQDLREWLAIQRRSPCVKTMTVG